MNECLNILIGGDIVPTDTNVQNFCDGSMNDFDRPASFRTVCGGFWAQAFYNHPLRVASSCFASFC